MSYKHIKLTMIRSTNLDIYIHQYLSNLCKEDRNIEVLKTIVLSQVHFKECPIFISFSTMRCYKSCNGPDP